MLKKEQVNWAPLPSPQSRVPLNGSPSWRAAAVQTPEHTAEVREKRAARTQPGLNPPRKELCDSLQSQPVACQVLAPFLPQLFDIWSDQEEHVRKLKVSSMEWKGVSNFKAEADLHTCEGVPLFFPGISVLLENHLLTSPTLPPLAPAQAHPHSDKAWCGESEDPCSGSGSATLAKRPITGAYTSLKYSSAVWWLSPYSSKILGAFDVDCSFIYQYPSEHQRIHTGRVQPWNHNLRLS